MEEWKSEVNRLNNLRSDLGISVYALAKSIGEDNSKLYKFFKASNEPALGFYLNIKNALENAVEVSPESVLVVGSKGGVEKVKKKLKPSCDCKMDGMLFIRGKSCKKAKDEHKF